MLRDAGTTAVPDRNLQRGDVAPWPVVEIKPPRSRLLWTDYGSMSLDISSSW